MNEYRTVIESDQSTVVAQYEHVAEQSTAYQSEEMLEHAFIYQLQEQKYEYVSLKTEDDLIVNLRRRLEELNHVQFNDGEWRRFYESEIANKNEGIVEKTEKLQRADTAISFTFDDGTLHNIRLLDKQHIHNNSLQVINQYEAPNGNYNNRYDVTILVNGLPMVHVELKRRGVDIKEAFNQINRYQRDSFWSDSGLFEYVQIFVISNGTYTKYYSNTTRNRHINESKTGSSKPGKKTSNSYEFTCWWADAKNRPITDLMDFTRTFFAKHTILNILTRYCVFTYDKTLMVMRPYQIVATERIINQIEIAHNYKYAGTIKAGGYVWHTTGSGKTLTSFKTAQLACQLDYIDKVLFVVDRKDLDYQTMREYDRFQKGAANSNTSTAKLTAQLKSNQPDKKLIITTIQKLSNFIKQNPGSEVMGKHIVMIFDECHRSQFGDMGQMIRKRFKNYYMFGFTGTPIFAANASTAGQPNFKTTEQTFGRRLHTYTIVDAIRDKNVLPFKFDYVGQARIADNVDNTPVAGINKESAMLAPKRISAIVQYIRKNFDLKTKRNVGTYEFNKLTNISQVAKARGRDSHEQKQSTRLNGFNSILATSSLTAAKLYYQEFQHQQADLTDTQRLKVAIIYSYAPNSEDPSEVQMGFGAEENSDSTDGLSQSDRDFLESAIFDYNQMFGTSYDTSADKFQSYYKDVSLRMKNRELDILIVVDMFLTGFDATTLNTLWVDKNLRMHGLIQAFSRTNRILNSIKTYGNIVSFRNLEQATKDALALFGDKDASGIVLLRSFKDYMDGYTDDHGRHQKGYNELIAELRDKFPLDGTIITGEEKQKEFVKLFGNILRARNILTAFDDFAGLDTLSPRELQDQQSRYIGIYDEMRNHTKVKQVDISDDVVFEMELVKSFDINIDYILSLIAEYHESNQQDKEIKINIDKAIESSLELRDKRDLIENFIASLNGNTSDVYEDWQDFVSSAKASELNQIIADENLNRDETYRFMRNAFINGEVSETGTGLTRILPPADYFSPGGERQALRERVYQKLRQFFDRFFSISTE